MYMKTNRDTILTANRAGLNDKETGDWTSYYTPLLVVAYNYGQAGVDLTQQPDVSGYRLGNVPESGLSRNHAADRTEKGLSLMALDGQPDHWSAAFIPGDRPRVAVSGMLSPDTGSDDEPLVLAYGIDILD